MQQKILQVMNNQTIGPCPSKWSFGIRYFFFFQAEDGIRDLTVTGVQTCALPIFKQPTPYLLEASALLGRTVDELVAAIGKLESLKGVAPHVAEVHRLETEADDLYYNALADLFAQDAYTPLQVMKWNRIYDLMEEAFDKSEDVGNCLE